MLLAAGVWGPSALASQMQASGKITLTGYVAPVKYVYVKDGKIAAIVSNSQQDAEPIMALNEKMTQTAPITADVYAQFISLKERYDLDRIGEVYNSHKENRLAVSQPAPAPASIGLNVFQAGLDIEHSSSGPILIAANQ